MRTALTIAGSDCSGGAGIQADIKTMSALGVYAMSVITSVVAENTLSVISSGDVSLKLVSDQLDAVFSDIRVDAVKIGMIPSVGCMEVIADKLNKFSPKIVVVDPVIAATDGTRLMGSLEEFIRLILPHATLITPNIPEAELISGRKITNEKDIEGAAKAILSLGAKAVLIKGGHLSGDATDTLYDGSEFHRFSCKRVSSNCTHGTGCTLSSAITAFLARGLSLPEAVAKAKEYLTAAIEDGIKVGKGHGPTNHFHEFFTAEGEKR